MQRKLKLTEMATERKEVIATLDDYRKTILEHLLKCCIYKNSTNSLHHWIFEELGNFFWYLGKLKVKKMIKLAEKDYKYHLFEASIEDAYDVECLLNGFLLDIKRKKINYPEFEITDDLIITSYNVFEDISETIPKMMANKDEFFSSATYSDTIEEILKRNGVR